MIKAFLWTLTNPVTNSSFNTVLLSVQIMARLIHVIPSRSLLRDLYPPILVII